jgi:uncharacterized lipoprotein YddW (UPF0748 family)
MTLPRGILFLVILLLTAGLLPARMLELEKLAKAGVPSGAATYAGNRNFGGKVGLEMRANFPTIPSQRAAWDFPLKTDLSQAAGLRLRYRCEHAEQASQFNIYLLVDKTWYAMVFSPEADGLWHEQIILKTAFSPEGEPASWKDCQKLRFAIWKGNSQPVIWQVLEMEVLTPNCNLALLRGIQAPDTRKETLAYCRHLGEALKLSGLLPAVIDEADCAVSVLRPYRLVLVPLPSALGNGALNSVQTYHQRGGGKLGLFHTVPPPLAASAHFPTGKFTRSSTLLSPLAQIVPAKDKLPGAAPFRQQSEALLAVTNVPKDCQATAWWHDARGQKTPFPAILENAYGFWMTHVYLNQDPELGARTLAAQLSHFLDGLPAAGAATVLSQTRFAVANARSGNPRLAEAKASLASAEKCFQQGQFNRAYDLSRASAQALQSGFSAVVLNKPREVRGIWSRRLSGLPGKTWAETARILARSGLNTVFPRLPDDLLTAQDLPRHLETIKYCQAACREQRLQVHFWLPCLGREDLPEAERQKLAAQHLLQQDAAGQTLPWLCPSQPLNRQRLVQVAVALAQSCEPDGIHLDLIRYPGSNACFCPTCRGAFARFVQRQPQNWPRDVQPGGVLHEAWKEFRCRTIASLVGDIRTSVHKVRAKVRVSAAVYPDLASCRQTVGQNWSGWLKDGNVDFVCPMDYRATAGQLAGDLARQVSQVGDPQTLLPGLGVSTARLSLQELSNQIQATRASPVAGFVLFELTPREALELLPALRLNGK